MNDDIISRSALKEAFKIEELYWGKRIIDTIDNAPTVEYPEQVTIKCDTGEDKQKLLSALRNAKLNVLVEEDERPHGECKTCRHRDPEDKKCDCGELERQGYLFSVSDDYFCKFYEKGDADMQGD